MALIQSLQNGLLYGLVTLTLLCGSAEAQNYRERGRKITSVERLLRPGERARVELHDEPIIAIDVVARRERGGTETQLSAEIENREQLGLKQVDQNVSHVIRWNIDGRNPRGQELMLRAINGEVYVESVHVLYDSDRFDDGARRRRRDEYDRGRYSDRDRYYDESDRDRYYEEDRYYRRN